MSRSAPTHGPTRRQMLAGLAGLAGGLLAATAKANADLPVEVGSHLPQARLWGQGRMRWLGWSVYDARLWVGPGFRAARWADTSLMLELVYARSLRGAAIAERSIEEMRRAGPLDDSQAARWLAALRGIFPDVNAGDRLSGWLQPAHGASFFFNGRAAGSLPDPQFARLFFGIWLAPHTSAPALREALLKPPAGEPGGPAGALEPTAAGRHEATR